MNSRNVHRSPDGRTNGPRLGRRRPTALTASAAWIASKAIDQLAEQKLISWPRAGRQTGISARAGASRSRGAGRRIGCGRSVRYTRLRMLSQLLNEYATSLDGQQQQQPASSTTTTTTTTTNAKEQHAGNLYNVCVVKALTERRN